MTELTRRNFLYAAGCLAASTSVSKAQTRVPADQQIGAVVPGRVTQSEIVLSPFQFQGRGDGVQDDSGAINAMFRYFRELMAQSGGQQAPIEISFSGGRWRLSDTVDATAITAWNWKMSGGHFYGECEGKPMFDLSGSRGYEINGIGFHGGRDRMPRSAWQAARLANSQFCDNVQFNDVAIDGFFSEACWVAFGQETAKHDHCTYYNSYHKGRVAIIEGYDGHSFVSEFGEVIRGSTSNVNVSLQGNCDFRYLPTLDQWQLADVSNSRSAVLTLSDHNLEAGDEVVFAYVGGMEYLSRVTAKVTAVTGDTVTTNLDTTSLETYTGGGVVIRRQTKSPLYIARTEGISLADAYIVAYGQPHIEIGFPDASFPFIEMFSAPRILFEGSGNESNIVFNTGAVETAKVLGFELSTYNSNAVEALISSNGGVIAIYKPVVDMFSSLWSATLLNNPKFFAMYGAEILFSSVDQTEADQMIAFNGRITSVSDGNTYEIGKIYID
ncbi:ubiquitin-activating E1 FCCH domain-containing protein [Rhizobium sp. EC-SD404]|uniref:ubiquitin-activating E1 FCCH domain-containing protein n=1 Tax=Rhizobium sp. EC-SD404 TaxID=2038389 RepID=UPI001252E126|nr:ubiquitin-activating E1 FCCH domain-containing protein [Rhizobium sp. EC-SD404]VVT32013.1 hypothetical protein RHIZ404_230465 [Rhizobium sp. EC-SD404]